MRKQQGFTLPELLLVVLVVSVWVLVAWVVIHFLSKFW